MKKILFLTTFCFIIFSSNGQNKIWTPISLKEVSLNADDLYSRKTTPINFKLYSLDLQKVSASLKNRKPNVTQIISLPTVNGNIEEFTIEETSALSSVLSAKYPMIKSYIGKGNEDINTTVRISLGTDGFHAVIFSLGKETYYIDPFTKNNTNYIAYKKSDLPKIDSDFQCFTENFGKSQAITIPNFERNANDGKLRIYRLALASTAEYSTFHLNNQNVALTAAEAIKKTAVLSAMNTTFTRVNGIFERDLSVKMELVGNNDDLLFFDATTDGFSNDLTNALINESQTKCDDIVGDANYDIGHTFSTGAGGAVVGFGAVCITGQKARGVTGTSNPINDPYDVDFVAHEIGHQFGANHTYNGTAGACNGQRNNVTAVEPGSGSTIMAYAGICGSNNVQSNSDDYFHAVSIAEMWNIITTSATCASEINTSNAAPSANAGADFAIPSLTPFVLRGIGTDSDIGNVLSYNWEQIDAEVGFNLPPSELSTGGALFRSLPPTVFPNRYMPSLATIISGDTATEWEVLPTVTRDLNFSFLVRDNNLGGGNSARDDVLISVVSGEVFNVTSQKDSIIWSGNTTQTITWNVANSALTPISCAKVNIKLSLDGGVTFPIILIENTDNDGSEAITAPDSATTQARIMVEAADNIFYNVNTINFTIEEAVPSIDDKSFNNFNLYPNPLGAVFNLKFDVVDKEQVCIQLFDIRGVLVKSFTFLNTEDTFAKEINLNDTASGMYLLKITNGNKHTTRKLIVE